jgi:hypothetical protein
VNQPKPTPSLETLTDADLGALRLGAQVLGHRAGPERRPAVARYFTALEDALKLEIGRRNAGARSAETAEQGTALPRPADAEDRRLVAEYFGLLIANERLSPSVRAVCRELRDRDSR